ncbi:dipeptidase [Petrachloros mirabilis]
MRTFDSYKPFTSNYKEVHKELLVIDGTTNLIALNKDPKFIDWYLKGGASAVVCTVSTAGMTATSNQKAQDQTLDILGYTHRLLQTRDDILLVHRADDVLTAKQSGKLGLILQFQGAVPIETNLDLVNLWKAAGVNVIQLAYNVRNQMANGITERVDEGLSKLGVELIKRLNEARVVVDCAHTGARSTLDACEFSNAPVVISHSNARGKYDIQRNAPDEAIKAVAKTGGLCGANMFTFFIGKDPRPTMDDYIGHIDYLVSLVGIDHVAIGPDYMAGQSGIAPDEVMVAAYKNLIASGAWDPENYPEPPYVYPEGVELPTTLYNLTDGLLHRGYSKEDIGKIMGGNWMRVLKAVLG